jgi:adenylate cyclase
LEQLGLLVIPPAPVPLTAAKFTLDAAGELGGMGMPLRLFQIVRFGTQGYPDKVARRLRAVNVTAWLGALVELFFAVLRFLDPGPKMLRRAMVNAAFALAMASVPLLHRFGQLAAPLALVVIVYTIIFWITYQVGTDGGSYLYYLIAGTLGILVLGTERPLLTVALSVVAIGLNVTLHLVLPRNTGDLSTPFGPFVINVVASSAILYAVVHYAFRQTAHAEAAAEREHALSEALLANILPQRVGARLKQRMDSVIADSYAEASVLFVDMAGFTTRASDTAPDELVRFLNDVFTRLDNLVERHRLEKIKTSGDGYMVVSGVPEPLADHAGALADLALDILDALAGLVDSKGRAVPVRLGIASGPVVAGVVGTRKFFYDVWGDAVNTASRMESTGVAGKIQVGPSTFELLADRFELEERGVIEVRGKKPMRTWFLIGRKPGVP